MDQQQKGEQINTVQFFFVKRFDDYFLKYIEKCVKENVYMLFRKDRSA